MPSQTTAHGGSFANILFQKGILTPGELARKMAEVEARFTEEAADRKPCP